MGVAGWGLGDWALIALNVGLSVSLPIITRLKLATSARLREAVLYSKPGRIAAWTVMLSGVACLSGLLSALLAVRYPVAWSSLLLAVGVLSAVLWYARRYHRTLQHMMREHQTRVEPPA
ncbi:hypothetical protein [Microbacterium saperdae]|uniref:Uncharacterized protein n=1 Tax=Microbacterium saperdae TaxID=69368 RepID=A0A543BCG5_9MICO|nr:hypothetical protein [Microbacterium saperdae]TQL82531.1 hypothetical protein FB560_4025 [Microbacterium saperdae]GGM40656.1 hypothetical protein GCM10010489_09570 [Microbacterium saperdae]